MAARGRVIWGTKELSQPATPGTMTTPTESFLPHTSLMTGFILSVLTPRRDYGSQLSPPSFCPLNCSSNRPTFHSRTHKHGLYELSRLVRFLQESFWCCWCCRQASSKFRNAPTPVYFMILQKSLYEYTLTLKLQLGFWKHEHVSFSITINRFVCIKMLIWIWKGVKLWQILLFH